MFQDIRKHRLNKPVLNPRPIGKTNPELDVGIDISDPNLKTLVIYPDNFNDGSEPHVGYLQSVPFAFEAVSHARELSQKEIDDLIPNERVMWYSGERMTTNGWPYTILSPYLSITESPRKNTDGAILANAFMMTWQVQGPVIFVRKK